MYRKLLFLMCLTNVALAGPWMTGPLLAPAGNTVPAGHINIEPYGFYTVYPMGFRNLAGTPIFTFGLNNFLDLQISAPFDYTWRKGQHGGGVGDASAALGIQILKQKEGSYLPDLRLLVQEVIPTGRFEDLDPRKLGTDQTGLGAYQTFLWFNFQQLLHLYDVHYLRTRLSLSVSKASKVKVHGFNVFGGGFLTEGIVNPGSSRSIDLAFEYSLTQHWVPVFEALYAHNSSVNFRGSSGFTPGGDTADIGGEKSDQLSFAPALEYNFNANIGVIGGVWFTVSERQSPKFTSGVIAINIYL